MKIRRIAVIQAGLREVGRIRMGIQEVTANGRIRPARLDTFRLTSRDEQALEAAAHEYGGKVTRWAEAPEGTGAQWQLTIQKPYLDVIVPPNGYESAFELWSGAGCRRRCDGVAEELSGLPCGQVYTMLRIDGRDQQVGPCPQEPRDRMEAAQKGMACKPTSRLRVMLPKLRGVGLWRLESHGYYAAVELGGMADFLDQAAIRGYDVVARLRIEKRSTSRPGEPRRDYIVPLLEIPSMTPAQLLAGPNREEPKQLPPGPVLPEMPEARDEAGRTFSEAAQDVIREIYTEAFDQEMEAIVGAQPKVVIDAEAKDVTEAWPSDDHEALQELQRRVTATHGNLARINKNAMESYGRRLPQLRAAELLQIAIAEGLA